MAAKGKDPTGFLKNKKLVAITGLVIVGLIILVGIVFLGLATRNYAAEAAAPIESALIANGAIQECVKGSDGRYPSNAEPWRETYFSINRNEADTRSLVEKVASDNGYSLTKGSPENRGHLTVDDKYIEAWYFASKPSTHNDLESGDIKLAMTVNSEGTENVCEEKRLQIDDSHSVVSVRVRLPLFKH